MNARKLQPHDNYENVVTQTRSQQIWRAYQ